MNEPLWQPGSERRSATRMASFMDFAARSFGRPFASYRELHATSIAQPESFWDALWDYCGVVGDKGAPPFLVEPDRMPGARFFPNARLNFTENVMRHFPQETALVFWGEDKVKRRVTSAELRAQIGQVQTMLREAGVAAGDRVAAILPNMPESIAAVLGAGAEGAVWSSCSPDFGVQGVLDRFGQIEPKVLIACDGYYYAGKAIDLSDRLAAIAARLPSAERIVIVSYLGHAEEIAQGLNASLMRQGRRAETWERAVLARPEVEPTFARLPFAHPLYILFSSGTTGIPKCIIHSAGGTLLKHLSEQQLHSDIRPGDRVFYFTTLGWMMWNWLVTCLGSGATLLLYDGSPFHPSGSVLWDYASAEGCTHFGTSAKYIDALK